MGRHTVKCEHGVVVSHATALSDGVTIVPCPENCGVRMLAEETMAELPMENAAQQRMRRDNLQGARGRFRGHDPYREI